MLTSLAIVLTKVSSFIANLNSVGCIWILIDEPEIPKSMLHQYRED